MAGWPSGMYYIEYQTQYGETPEKIPCDVDYFVNDYLPILSYPGKKFLGWSLSVNSTDLIKVNDEIYEEWFAPESIILYAVWEEEEEIIEYIVKSNKIQAIADAIRNKLNITDQMLIDDMPQKIEAIVGDNEVCDITICHDYTQYYSSMEIIYLDKNSQVQTLTLGYSTNLSGLINPLKNSIFIIKLLTPPGACPQGKMTWNTSCNLYDKNNNFLNTIYNGGLTGSLNINIPLVFQALGDDAIIFGPGGTVVPK